MAARIRRLLVIVAAATVLGTGSAGPRALAGEIDLIRLVRGLTDLDRLPVLVDGEVSRQFSSYDRASKIEPNGEKVNWGANGDAGHYIRVDPSGEAVMAEIEGPGAMVQTWSANPQGKLHFYVDGATEPIVFDFTAFTTGGIPEIPPPISTKGGGAGCNSYLPIPYARSLVIKADKPHGQYYHFDCVTFPAGTKVTSFRWPLSASEKAAVREAAAWLEKRCGEDPGPARAGSKTRTANVLVGPGATAVLAELAGPATVTSLKLMLEGTKRARRDVLLRAFWDGAEKPSIEAPIGDFFASTWVDVPFRSLPIGMTESGGYCYFRMPFSTGARIEVRNDGPAEARVTAEVAFAPGGWSDDTGYFHAKWRREAPNVTFEWPYLRCEGRGRWVGVQMSVQNPDPPWFGEGDEKVWVDGEAFPSWFGTGTEDYFCDAWGFRPFIQSTHGCPMYNEPGKTTVYRWHILDSIPFRKTFEITIENYANNKDYSAVAYWYATPPNGDFFASPTIAERIPWPTKFPGVIEAEDIAASAKVIADEGLPFELSGGKGIRLEAGGPEVALRIPMDAKDAYRFVLVGPKGQTGAGLEAKAGAEVAIAAAAPAFGGTDRLAGAKREVLEKGAFELAVKATGSPGASVILDAVRLEPSPKTPGVIEAESLDARATGGGTATLEYALDGDIASGCALLRFSAARVGDALELRLPAERSGRFQVEARFLRGPSGGTFACGDTLIDAHAAQVAPVEAPLGLFEIGGSAGPLRIEARGKPDGSTGVDLALDWLRLRRIVVDGAIEAEGLKVLREKDSSHQTQELGELWSGRTQLFCPGREGQFIELELPIVKAGTYALDIYFTKAGDYGIVEVEVDGKPLGAKFNGHNDGVLPSGKVGFGAVELSAGPHRILFRCREKDPRSSNFFFGVDCLTLTAAR